MDLLPRYEKLPDISATQDELLFLAFLFLYILHRMKVIKYLKLTNLSNRLSSP